MACPRPGATIVVGETGRGQAIAPPIRGQPLRFRGYINSEQSCLCYHAAHLQSTCNLVQATWHIGVVALADGQVHRQQLPRNNRGNRAEPFGNAFFNR